MPRKPARTPRSREQTKKETRDALIRAGLAAFAEEGLDVSLDAICDRAGFTRGAFYVHFADREELLVAVMDHVGESFLASVFAGLSSDEHRAARRRGALRTVAERFLASVKDGTYPLMPASGKKPMVRMHQLLDACARSPVVRDRYRSLVEASIAGVRGLALDDQHANAVRGDVGAGELGRIMLAVVIGAQTMGELGVAVDPAEITRAMLKLIAPWE